MSDTVERLRKLLALADDSDSPESQTARKLYERLLERHGLSPDAVEGGAPTWHSFSYKRGGKVIAARLILHFQFPARVRRGERQVVEVHCTRDEQKMLRDLYAHAQGVADAKRKGLNVVHESFVLGYLDRAFPRQWCNLTCPACGLDYYNYSESRRRFICGKCGHQGRKFQGFEGDERAYLAGIRHGARTLTAHRLPEGQQPEAEAIYYTEADR